MEEPQGDMTRQEAQHWLSQIRGTEARLQTLLLEGHDRKAYKALSYNTWEEFAQGELGVSVQHYNRLLSAARVERNLEHKCSVSNQKSTGLPLTYALELAKLPSAELQAAAYQEAVEQGRIMTCCLMPLV